MADENAPPGHRKFHVFCDYPCPVTGASEVLALQDVTSQAASASNMECVISSALGVATPCAKRRFDGCSGVKPSREQGDSPLVGGMNRPMKAPRKTDASCHCSSLVVVSPKPRARQALPSFLIAKILDMIRPEELTEPYLLQQNLTTDFKKESLCENRTCSMIGQAEIDVRMRARLVDWLASVHAKFKFSRRSLFLAVCILDQYLHERQVLKQHFQLVGICSLLIASKVEERAPLDLARACWLCAGFYTKKEVEAMDMEILRVLDYCVEGSTVVEFLPHFIAASNALANLGCDPVRPCGLAFVDFAWRYGTEGSSTDKQRNQFAWYFAELSLLDTNLVCYPPSHIAAAALILSNRVMGARTVWPDALAEMTGYAEDSLAACVADLNILHTATIGSSLQAIPKRNPKIMASSI